MLKIFNDPAEFANTFIKLHKNDPTIRISMYPGYILLPAETLGNPTHQDYYLQEDGTYTLLTAEDVLIRNNRIDKLPSFEGLVKGENIVQSEVEKIRNKIKNLKI